MESERLKAILESLLLAADGPVSADRLRDAVGEIPRKAVTDALGELRREYEEAGRGLRLAEVANGYQLRTPSEHAEFVRRLTAVKPARMSRATLETLAIIAYRQPVTRAEIEEIRGVNVDGVVSTLLERRMIRIVARKDVAGKPFLYGTTGEFLEAFNLKDLKSLPTLQEMEELTQSLPEPGAEVQGKAGPEAAPDEGEAADSQENPE
ncbi:MAG: SMC-Scp complex subunit ScpB [Deltaproteobacteria bacterium]|nr:SMC-Scp complex subunit ScpB [Deltaproteobacteria bacterium]